MDKKLSAEKVLMRYKNDDLPEFAEIELANVNQRGNFGNTPLHVACVRGYIEEVQAFLDAGAEVNIKGELDNTPLHEASRQGHLSIVRLLLNAGASLQIVNYEGNTARDVAVILHLNDIIAIFDEWAGDTH